MKLFQLGFACGLLLASISSPTTAVADDADIMVRMGFNPAEVKAQREKDMKEAADGTKRARLEAQEKAALVTVAKAEKDPLDQAAEERIAIIGMNVQQLVKAWGVPSKINQTVTAAGTSQQWVYSGDRYLYVDNGKLTAIQGPVKAPPRPPEIITTGSSLPTPLTMQRSW
jgi:hypothetical protein